MRISDLFKRNKKVVAFVAAGALLAAYLTFFNGCKNAEEKGPEAKKDKIVRTIIDSSGAIENHIIHARDVLADPNATIAQIDSSTDEMLIVKGFFKGIRQKDINNGRIKGWIEISDGNTAETLLHQTDATIAELGVKRAQTLKAQGLAK